MGCLTQKPTFPKTRFWPAPDLKDIAPCGASSMRMLFQTRPSDSSGHPNGDRPYASPKQECSGEGARPDDVCAQQAIGQRYRAERRNARMINQVPKWPSAGNEVAALLTILTAGIRDSDMAGDGARGKGGPDRRKQNYLRHQLAGHVDLPCQTGIRHPVTVLPNPGAASASAMAAERDEWATPSATWLSESSSMLSETKRWRPFPSDRFVRTISPHRHSYLLATCSPHSSSLPPRYRKSDAAGRPLLAVSAAADGTIVTASNIQPPTFRR